jgi:hypothetical protein
MLQRFSGKQTGSVKRSDGSKLGQGRIGLFIATWRHLLRRFLALFAVQVCAEMLLPSNLADHPGAIEKGRLMSHVLPMAAGQLSHPISVFVLVIPDDRLLHTPLCVIYRTTGTTVRDTMFRTDPFVIKTVLPVSVLRTAVQDAERRENTSIASPHPGRNFLEISPRDPDAETRRDSFGTSGNR